MFAMKLFVIFTVVLLSTIASVYIFFVNRGYARKKKALEIDASSTSNMKENEPNNQSKQ